jgi:hypothetical protein
MPRQRAFQQATSQRSGAFGAGDGTKASTGLQVGNGAVGAASGGFRAATPTGTDPKQDQQLQSRNAIGRGRITPRQRSLNKRNARAKLNARRHATKRGQGIVAPRPPGVKRKPRRLPPRVRPPITAQPPQRPPVFQPFPSQPPPITLDPRENFQPQPRPVIDGSIGQPVPIQYQQYQRR